MRERPLVLAGIVVLVGFVGALLVSGNGSWAIAGVVFAALCAAAYGFDLALKRRQESRSGGPDEAISDHTDPIPASHRIPDDETALGDTPEAHDEISPHDLPPDHPGRQAAERSGTTPGG